MLTGIDDASRFKLARHGRRALSAGVCLLSALLLPTGVSAADDLPELFVEETVTATLNEPVNLVTLPDGRMLVLEKAGVVKLLNPAVVPSPTTTVLTLQNVDTLAERGLASIALDPNFTSNGYLYLYYTLETNDNRNRISRFQFNFASSTITGPEVLAWEDNEPASNLYHYGGGLDFGPDGMLYLATGEEFEPAQSQDLTRGGGKMIRIDTRALDAEGPWVRGGNNDHIIPDDNPASIMDGPGGNLDEIWAYGIRNPFRMHWDIPGNRLYIGEVGGNIQATAREDLHIGRAGANYGWPECEGFCTNPEYDDPIYTYPHTGVTPSGGAIAAGFVYRGGQFPNSYTGQFFFADYALGYIKSLQFNAAGEVAAVNDFATNAGAIVALEQGPEGALYAVDYFGGRLMRFSYNSGNQQPIITQAEASVLGGVPPITVTFTAAATDAENDPLSYEWFFGDGTTADGAMAVKTYTETGLFNAFVVVSDSLNSSTSELLPIQVGGAPIAQIDFPADGATFRAGETIAFGGSATDPDESGQLTYEWDIDFFHNAHVHPALAATGTTGTLPVETSGHDYHDDTGYQFNLTVTDSDNLSTTASVRIYPDKVNMNLQSVPEGLPITVDGLPLATPLVYDTVIDFEHLVSVPQSLCTNGTQYNFASWSDGQARTHVLTVPARDFDLVATFENAGACDIIPTEGLVAHFEADQGVETTGELQGNGGDPIVSWTDLSGNGNTMVVGSGNPLLMPGAVAGKPAVDFDGIDDVLRRDANLNGFPLGASDRSMYMVASYESVGQGGVTYGEGRTNALFGLHVTDAGLLRVNAFGAPDSDSNVVGTDAGWLVHGAVVNNNQLSHLRDGELIGTAQNTYNTAEGDLILGADFDEQPFVDMQVAAILLYNRALSAAEQQAVQDYLEGKYFSDDVTLPVARNDDTSVLSGGAVDVNVLANDTSGRGAVVSIVDAPENGTATVIADTNTIRYVHGGQSQSDTFTYVVTNSAGIASASARVSVSVVEAGELVTAGLVMRLESDAGVGTVGRTVTGWNDQSGFGNDLRAFGDPQQVPGGLGTLPSIAFDGDGDVIERPGNIAGLPSGNKDRSVFVLAKYNSGGFGGFSYGNDDDNQNFGLVVDNSAAGLLSVQGWGTVNDFRSDSAAVGQDWLVHSAVLNDSVLTQYRDGALIGTVNHAFATSVERIIIGAEIDTNPTVDMELGAVLVYNRALSDAEQRAVKLYLDQKFQATTLADASNARARPVPDAGSGNAAVQGAQGGETIAASTLLGALADVLGGSDSASDASRDADAADDNTSSGQLTDTGAGAGASLPSSGLVAHFSADQNAALDSHAVREWIDRTDAGLALMGEGGVLLIPNALNGLPVLDLDGVDDRLLSDASGHVLPSGADDRSVFIVVSYEGTGDTGVAFGEDAESAAFGLKLSSESAIFSVLAERERTSTGEGLLGMGSGWVVHGAVLASDQLTQLVDAQAIDSRTERFATGTGPLVVGSNAGGDAFVEMQIAEILIYDRALDDVEVRQLQDFLNNKYDLSNN